MKQKIRIIAIILLLINVLTCINVTKAATLNSANLYSKGDCGTLLKYNGTNVYTTFVVYNNNGVEYPAYCMQKELNGVGESGAYTVNINGLLTDVKLWRTITNGYPYKTLQQLGCLTTQEAYTATKQAVYCTIYGNNINNYSAVGEAGTRTLNALKTIVNAAKNSNATKVSADIQLVEENNTWNIDTINSNYLSKTYSIKSETSTGKYKINLSGKLPEETLITDIKNTEKKEFSIGEKFKVLLPIANAKTANTFKINVTSTVNTKPVFYGKAPKSTLQDYAITAATYEDATGSLTQNYQENLTQIVIKKQDGDTKQPLAGVVFNLLDENKTIVYKGLISDEQGKIILSNMIPGKYFLQEISTKEGYTAYDKLIEINLDLNEVVNITVNNSKTQVSNITNSEENINVSKKEAEINVTNKTENTNIEENKTTQNTNIINENKIIKTNEENNSKLESNNSISNDTTSENNNVTKRNETTENKNTTINNNVVENNNSLRNENTAENNNTTRSNGVIENQNRTENNNITENNNSLRNQNTLENNNINKNNNTINNENTTLNNNVIENSNTVKNNNTLENTNIIENTNNVISTNTEMQVIKLPKTGM